ncbi:hypothetical protein D3C86_1627680 [compost metagenome]
MQFDGEHISVGLRIQPRTTCAQAGEGWPTGDLQAEAHASTPCRAFRQQRIAVKPQGQAAPQRLAIETIGQQRRQLFALGAGWQQHQRHVAAQPRNRPQRFADRRDQHLGLVAFT